MFEDYDLWFWVKFIGLSLTFMIIIWFLGGQSLPLKWRLLFTICSPLGVFLALTGRSLRGGQ